MECKICGNREAGITYKGLIRNGGLGQYTKEEVVMWQCAECDAIWHEPLINNAEYYESQEYRQSLEGTSEEKDFYRMHDKENLDKFRYTGTAVFRDKIVADIGCGCGAFLDFVRGAANEVIAVEPSETYRNIMNNKGFYTYAYSDDAKEKWGGRVEVITSFDVIEHVESPMKFIADVYDLLAVGGSGIIGTPTDAPVMRELLGELYEQQQLFSTQHLWVLGEKNLKYMASKAGFSKISIKYYQRYGLKNFLGWLRDKKTRSDICSPNISETLSETWKADLESRGLADYIVLYVEK